MLKISNKLLSFRYKKTFILNHIKYKKLNLENKKIKTESHKSCPICDGREVDLIAEVDRIGFRCDTVVCKQCYFVFNNTYIRDPVDFYTNVWGSERWGDPEESFNKRTDSNSYSWKRMAFLAMSLGERFKELNTVLEVGCGDGCNLYPYHLQGRSTVGCDFNEDFLKPGRSKGLHLVCGDIDSIEKDKVFDLVLLIHSFEHVIDMDKPIQSVAKHVAEDGLVFVEVPGVLGWNRVSNDVMQSMGLISTNNFLSYLQFQHNYHFDLDHLRVVWERNGFELVQGDEWVRAIFRRREKSLSGFGKGVALESVRKDSQYYLSMVEKDFLSIKFIFCRCCRFLLRKMSVNS